MREMTDVSQIQQVLLGALTHFKAVCEKNGLTFFLSNGSMLGAVKYQKFIPWDDDADILMPREDYDKLLRLTDIDTETYQLLCRERTPGWRIPYAKLTDKRTVLKEGEFDFGAELGVSVDIFPIDKWHPNAGRARFQARWQNVLIRLLFGANAPRFTTPKRGVQKAILYGIWLAGHAVGAQRLCRTVVRRAERFARYPDRYMGCVVWSIYGTREVIPGEVFAAAETVRFCDDDFPVPKGYDAYLTNLYGDWRKELPPEKQKSHHVIRAWWKDE